MKMMNNMKDILLEQQDQRNEELMTLFHCSTCKSSLQNNIIASMKGTQYSDPYVSEGLIFLENPRFERAYDVSTFCCKTCGEPCEGTEEMIKSLLVVDESVTEIYESL